MLVVAPGDVLNVPLRHSQLGQVLLAVDQPGPQLLHQLLRGLLLGPRQELDVETEPLTLGEDFQSVHHRHQV